MNWSGLIRVLAGSARESRPGNKKGRQLKGESDGQSPGHGE